MKLTEELKPLLCRHCNFPLGQATADRLYLGAASFTRTVTLECRCGTRLQWKPGLAETDRRE